MSDFNFKQKPSGFFKWVLHAPTWLFRAHLGFIMGERFLMIEHTGRRSGKQYRTVLEVAGRNRERNEWISASGTGPKADWFRNISAGGLNAVWIGTTRHQATPRFLDDPEAAEVMLGYEQDHPSAAAKLIESMGVSYDGTSEGRTAMMHKIPMVGFTVQ